MNVFLSTKKYRENDDLDVKIKQDYGEYAMVMDYTSLTTEMIYNLATSFYFEHHGESVCRAFIKHNNARFFNSQEHYFIEIKQEVLIPTFKDYWSLYQDLHIAYTNGYELCSWYDVCLPVVVCIPQQTIKSMRKKIVVQGEYDDLVLTQDNEMEVNCIKKETPISFQNLLKMC